MEKEENIPNFIGYAVVIITAHYLGCEVEMLETAKEVWNTKRMPDAPMLGYYQKAAFAAVESIKEKGLAEEANHLGVVFYHTGEFPEACEIAQYRDYLSMYVLRNTLGDCTAGGVSSGGNNFYVFASYLSFSQVVNHCIKNHIDLCQSLKLVYRKNQDYIHAEPVIARSKHYMVGGNYIYTSDSRFERLTGIRYPIPVHDRREG